LGTLFEALSNFGALGVIVMLMILGYLVPKTTVDRLDTENKLLKDSLDIERKRSDELSKVGDVTGQLLKALTDSMERRPLCGDGIGNWTNALLMRQWSIKSLSNRLKTPNTKLKIWKRRLKCKKAFRTIHLLTQ
jgi:hypothetical protein